ncbi:methyltransferase domain-containing protein [Lentisphaerota bacterium ZTH]|nr:class I SAM-dependent methyltransferase [Lentisphaerota bacterium]WET06060.1 methyltransferase domain-containing protein [Lentisphaerota bacterium ZTH]
MSDKLRRYWDNLAGKKQFTIKLLPELILPCLPESPRILDYGCGYGRTLLQLRGLGFKRLAGTDISTAMLELATKALPQAEFVECNNFLTPWPDASFDLILVIGVLTSVVDTQDQHRLIKEVLRLLRPGGYIYLSDFLLNNDPRNIERYCKYQPEYGAYGIFKLPDGGLLRHHDINYICSLLEKFEQKELKEMQHTTMNGHNSNGFAYVGRKSAIYP